MRGISTAPQIMPPTMPEARRKKKPPASLKSGPILLSQTKSGSLLMKTAKPYRIITSPERAKTSFLAASIFMMN